MTKDGIHINQPSGYYIGQVSDYSSSKYKTVTGKCKAAESAMSKAVLKMGNSNYARVMFLDSDGRYAPTLIMECKR
jgi:hypothetical protein